MIKEETNLNSCLVMALGIIGLKDIQINKIAEVLLSGHITNIQIAKAQQTFQAGRFFTLVKYSFNENNKFLSIREPEGPEGNQLTEMLVNLVISILVA